MPFQMKEKNATYNTIKMKKKQGSTYKDREN